jgi:hydroxyacylglutathione hydrolase
LFEGTPEQMLGSLNKLAELPTETEVYCTHEYTQANLRFAKACEPANTELSSRAVAVDALRAANEMTLPSTLGLELATNPFLRCKEEGVIAAAEKFSGVRPATTVEAFAAIRAWKDEF